MGSITQQIDTDQTYRYAEASGDNMPIHLDEEIAKSVGLPGIIIHGLCTMAFTSWAAIQAVAGGDPTRLKRLAVRFSRPVLPGQADHHDVLGRGRGRRQPGVRLRDPQRRRRGRDQGRARRGRSA